MILSDIEFRKCMIFVKNGTTHALDSSELRKKCSVNYPSECSIFQNGISCFNYNLFINIFYF